MVIRREWPTAAVGQHRFGLGATTLFVRTGRWFPRSKAERIRLHHLHADIVEARGPQTAGQRSWINDDHRVAEMEHPKGAAVKAIRARENPARTQDSRNFRHQGVLQRD